MALNLEEGDCMCVGSKRQGGFSMAKMANQMAQKGHGSGSSLRMARG